jgi:hypothetical protein
MHERVAELTALVEGALRLRRDVAGNPTREGELPKQPPQPLLVAADMGVDLAVGALEIGVCNQAGPAVTRAGDEDHVEVARPNRSVEMGVEEIQPRRGAPVAKQSRLNVLGAQRLAQQRVVEQVDLAHGQVVGSAPPAIDQLELAHSQRAVGEARSIGSSSGQWRLNRISGDGGYTHAFGGVRPR